MRMINTSGHEYDSQGELELQEVIPPNGTCEIEDGYCRAGVTANGSRRPSIVERLAPFLVPEDAAMRERWGKEEVVSEPPPPTVIQTAANLVAEGVSPGVAELVATGNVEPVKRKPGRPPKVRE